MKLVSLAVAVGIVSVSTGAVRASESNLPYRDPGRPAEKRVKDLLKRMTVEEKLGQMSQWLMSRASETNLSTALRQGQVGALLPSIEVVGDVAMRNRLQKVAVEESRLGIPFMMGFDAIHGFRTVFPIPLAMASTWDPGLVEKVQSVAAIECSAGGVDWTFAPMVDLARDPRWGRIAEGFGEDPYLGQLYAAAAVRGFQGAVPDDPRHVAACLKHYVAYGAAEGGRDYNTTDISEYSLRNAYLPAFKAGVEAGAVTVMSAFNCLSGIPASANHHTLAEILRGEWGFAGFVVSDWESVLELKEHGVAANDAECARLAVTAGVDMEMVSATYRDTLLPQIREGGVPEAGVDEAVRRILRIKFQRGLFEHPYCDEARQKTDYLTPDAVKLAREAAVKSCVLLKNYKDLLPLRRDGLKLALIGPLGAEQDELMGSWNGNGQVGDVVTLERGIRAKLERGATLVVGRGCDIVCGRQTITLEDGSIVDDPMNPKVHACESDFEAAVKIAATADVVVMALGEPRGWSGENATRSQLDLPGRQMDLFDAVVAVGKPVVVVLINGRPLAIPKVVEKAAAVLEAWQPGTQGGNAVADLLFGDASPSGRLTATVPRSVGQVPVYYNRLNTGRPRSQDYADGTSRPLYPFGFGLTYGAVQYGAVDLNAKELTAGGTLLASTTVQNTGRRTAEEVVQLYIRDVAASRARPVRELKGFQKIRVVPGEIKRVTFSLAPDDLVFLDETGKKHLEPGAFQVWIAPHAGAGAPATFELK